MREEWKNVVYDGVNYEGYQVSNTGEIRSLKTGKILKQEKTNNGYLLTNLYKNGKRKKLLVHRLVAEAFIPNPLNLPEVNHKSENKQDNRVENLEYCDSSYNINYGNRNEKVAKKLSKNVLQFTKTGNFIREWSSLHEIQKQLGYCFPNISKCCLGDIKSAYGFKWEYKKEVV